MPSQSSAYALAAIKSLSERAAVTIRRELDRLGHRKKEIVVELVGVGLRLTHTDATIYTTSPSAVIKTLKRMEVPVTPEDTWKKIRMANEEQKLLDGRVTRSVAGRAVALVLLLLLASAISRAIW